jgi:NADH:ubiquinone oxidoreductase subunit 5 (subunit L)/multisubunit Na+/H+ antiporter MnhA subunit
LSLLHLVILAPFILAIFVPLLYKYVRQIHTGWFVLTLPVLLFTYLIQYIPVVSRGESTIASLDWIPSLDIYYTVYVDGLGLLFSLLITGIGSLVVLYSIYYLSKNTEALHNFYVYLLMFMGAMLGVVLSDNLMVLYVFWELTSLSSFLLIAYWYQREKSRYGAQKSLLITVFGGFSMLAGFVLLYVMSGTFSIREIIAQLDVDKYIGNDEVNSVIVIEQNWFKRMLESTLYIYEFETNNFVLQDEIAGYYVSSTTEVPISVTKIDDLFSALFNGNVELRFVPNLWPLFDDIRESSLGYSMCRMKFAQPRN